MFEERHRAELRAALWDLINDLYIHEPDRDLYRSVYGSDLDGRLRLTSGCIRAHVDQVIDKRLGR